jgi:hypothetical protein
LIEKGDSLSILAEESLQETFNELLKLELIDIVEDKLVLTVKGEKAKAEGFEYFITKMKKEKKVQQTSQETKRKSKSFSVLSAFLVICIILLLLSPVACSMT